MTSQKQAESSVGPAAFEGVRVLDLSGRAGQYCGKLFADLGAEVILVEPPGGSDTRREAPFVKHQAGPEMSLTFAYLNTSKRGITLDLDRAEGQAVLRRLVGDADILIESGKPGTMAARGLGYADLAAVNPALVYASISAFGQTGPYAQYEADDLTALALGGLLYLGGYADGVPVAAYGNQAYAAGSLFAAVSAAAVFFSAEVSGQGDFIDISMQECVTLAMENAAQTYDLEGTVRKRFGGTERQAGLGVFRCKDGHIFLVAGGAAPKKFWLATIKWMQEENVPGADELNEPQWQEIPFLQSERGKTRFKEIIQSFTMTRTKAELVEISRERRIPLSPVSTPADVVGNRQLAHRHFFVDVFNQAAGGSIRMPGAPYKLSVSPWAIARPAPSLGQHNREILGGLGLTAAEIEGLAAKGVI